MDRLFLTLAAASLALGSCGATPKENEPIPPPAEAPATKALPPPQTEGGTPLNEAIAARRSVRTYAARKLTDAEVGQLLWAGQGLTGGDGKRTAPSAGALYPLTLYYADDVSLWRYEPEGHALVRVGAGDKRPELTAAALGQAPLKNAAAIIIVVARPAVTAAKYGDRAERYCMLEAGHVAQNILLTAAALGLGACPVGAFRDDGVLAALALNADFLPLYLIPVGRAYN